MPRKRPRSPTTILKRPSELERIEAFCDTLVARMGSGNRATAARIVGTLDRDRRDRDRARRDPTFTPRTRVGSMRTAEITRMLETTGWTLRETVDRKLPLLHLPEDLKQLVREGLEPSKALLLGRVKQTALRRELSERIRRGMTQRELYAAMYGSAQREQVVLDADLAWLSLEATRALGTRVTITGTTIMIDCVTIDGLNYLLEQLGVIT